MLKLGLITSLIVKGGFIGIANIIPGVSGGTMAIVLGIYERLIRALHHIGFSTVQKILAGITLKRGALSEARSELRRIDFGFLTALAIGAVLAIKASSDLILYLLNNQHDPTYGFFCGLILSCVIIPFKMIKRFTVRSLLSLLIAAVLTVGLTMGMSGEKNLENARKKYELKAGRQTNTPSASETAIETDRSTFTPHNTPIKIGADHSVIRLLYLFFCGAISVSAMILPGISGSFIMLLFGVYFDVIAAVSRWDWLVLAVFAVGCSIGLLVFTRLLNYVLERYHNLTISFLIGLMSGSLYGLWPFRDYEIVGSERIDVAHIIPQLDMNLLITVLAFLVGCGMILLFYRFEKGAVA